MPGLGRIHEGEQVDGGGGHFDTDTDNIVIDIPASCDTTETVHFVPSSRRQLPLQVRNASRVRRAR